MKLNLIETKEILDYQEEIGYELVVTERPITDKHPLRNPTRYYVKYPRYFVQFENSDIMADGVLIGCTGNGDTIDEAIRDYCVQISNRRVAFNAFSNNRKEIVFPKLVHTKQEKYNSTNNDISNILNKRSNEAIGNGNQFKGFLGIKPDDFTKDELIMMLNILNDKITNCFDSTL